MSEGKVQYYDQILSQVVVFDDGKFGYYGNEEDTGKERYVSHSEAFKLLVDYMGFIEEMLPTAADEHFFHASSGDQSSTITRLRNDKRDLNKQLEEAKV